VIVSPVVVPAFSGSHAWLLKLNALIAAEIDRRARPWRERRP